jgi:acyl-CoA synthetase (AMP-forming)/AMP-acid ligase II
VISGEISTTESMNAFDYFFENTGKLEKDFVCGPKETISFCDLYSRSLKLAFYLNTTFGVDQNILLLAPNSVFFITAYLAILKSGNIVVPLNSETEHKNLSFIREKCNSGLTITTSQLRTKLAFGDSVILDEMALEDILSSTSAHGILKHETFTEPETSSEQLAEIIFTSGSTGEPKGVMISHKNLIANTASIVEYLSLSRQDTMLVILPFYYCYGLSLLHTHLRAGGSIVLNNMFIMLGGVLRDLKQYKCTGFAGVPAHFQILLRKSESFKNTLFPDLRYVTQAGGKLHNAFISEFTEAFPGIRFIVMYGQTEATARLSWLPPEKLPEKKGSCGMAIPGVTLKVADRNGNPVKQGETGEIMAFGDNIMIGYYKDPESTQRTLANGWLHTGDLAWMDEEGYLYLTARIKEIIKVGGRRVSPKEIEEVIVSMPEVIDCSIEAVYNDILGETMKATVVVKEPASQTGGDKITPEVIKSWCASRLALFKIPQIIEFKDGITITATGKAVRK